MLYAIMDMYAQIVSAAGSISWLTIESNVLSIIREFIQAQYNIAGGSPVISLVETIIRAFANQSIMWLIPILLWVAYTRLRRRSQPPSEGVRLSGYISVDIDFETESLATFHSIDEHLVSGKIQYGFHSDLVVGLHKESSLYLCMYQKIVLGFRIVSSQYEHTKYNFVVAYVKSASELVYLKQINSSYKHTILSAAQLNDLYIPLQTKLTICYIMYMKYKQLSSLIIVKGAPGSGKTYLVNLLADLCNMSVVEASCKDLLYNVHRDTFLVYNELDKDPYYHNMLQVHALLSSDSPSQEDMDCINELVGDSHENNFYQRLGTTASCVEIVTSNTTDIERNIFCITNIAQSNTYLMPYNEETELAFHRRIVCITTTMPTAEELESPAQIPTSSPNHLERCRKIGARLILLNYLGLGYALLNEQADNKSEYYIYLINALDYIESVILDRK